MVQNQISKMSTLEYALINVGLRGTWWHTIDSGAQATSIFSIWMRKLIYRPFLVIGVAGTATCSKVDLKDASFIRAKRVTKTSQSLNGQMPVGLL